MPTAAPGSRFSVTNRAVIASRRWTSMARIMATRRAPGAPAGAPDSVRDGGRGLLWHHRLVREAGESERGDQLRRLAGRGHLGHGLAADGGGLEAPGAPTGVEVEVLHLGLAH